MQSFGVGGKRVFKLGHRDGAGGGRPNTAAAKPPGAGCEGGCRLCTRLPCMNEAECRVTAWQLGRPSAMLDLSGLGLCELPPIPLSVRRLNVSRNILKRLPTRLPRLLETLLCAHNLLEELPVLTQCLVVLDCTWNCLRVLPRMPSAMRSLRCSNNCIRVLPQCPRDLEDLTCEFNNLWDLGVLPPGLLELHCSGNSLHWLPRARPPKLHTLSCSQNPLPAVYVWPEMRLEDFWAVVVPLAGRQTGAAKTP